MRKHVKPAHPQAAIPDPVRGGDLPPEGRAVDWSAHWARLALRGDIITTDLDEGDAKVKKPAAPATKAAKTSRIASPGRRRKTAPAPDPVPTGEALAESGPQVEGPEMDAPAAPAAPEAPLT